MQSTERRLAIEVRGVVQGVGFRPFVYNAAQVRGLTGWVQNQADLVRIEIQGEPAAIDTFLDALQHHHPPQARIDAIRTLDKPCENGPDRQFAIRPSDQDSSPRPTIPADLATCSECLREISTPGERRHRYPFTNCTNCGPRWSIIEQLPYDRPRTSMAAFRMCEACEAEYRDPADRRFHAQPIACPTCGPAVELLDAAGRRLAAWDQAIEAAADAVLSGQVLALKGLGGFQLIVDATSDEAVILLRQRKHRPNKPFAVMMRSIEEVRLCCEVSEEEAREIGSHQAPILLLRKKNWPNEQQVALTPRPSPASGRGEEGAAERPDGRSHAERGNEEEARSGGGDATVDRGFVGEERKIADAVAPGNPYLGVMLPYTPLHHLLMAAIDRPIVCTSGNLSEEPMAITTEDALARLGAIADVFLVHDRPIVRPVDDSVARVGPRGLELHRRARGFAPLPIELGRTGPTVLAVGGHLKNTVALSLGSQVVMNSHVGDLDNRLSVDVHRQAIDDLIKFFRVTPEVVACDLHPDYASTRVAESLAAEWKKPLVRVQHHHAHVAACMAEHRLDGPVLGFSWDGTGYGQDGTVWGGEVLECQGAEYRRMAHLRTFAMPGGDRAAREPRRSALGLLFEMLGDGAREHVQDWFSPAELENLLRILHRPKICPRTSSMGRLFDAIAAICGLSRVISFEGQAAMALEFAALPTGEGGAEGGANDECEMMNAERKPDDGLNSLFIIHHSLFLSDSTSTGNLVLDWEPQVRAILADRVAGESKAQISARFHQSLAEMALAVAKEWDGHQIALTGGCFQNARLRRCVEARLAQHGFEVFTHREVPPGDGGIALGQVKVAVEMHRG